VSKKLADINMQFSVSFYNSYVIFIDAERSLIPFFSTSRL
jgi:hypothetical protein